MASTVVATTSVTYNPISAGFSSNTLYFYLPNDANTKATLHKITGVRGDFELNLAVKTIPTIKFTMTGLYNAPIGVAPPTSISFGKFIKPVPPNSQNTTGVTLFGYATPALEKFNLKIGNKVEFRNLVGDQYVFLSDRNSMGQVDFEALTPDVFDMFAAANVGTPGAISFTHGTVAGNKVAVSIPKSQPQNPTYADSTGVQMFQVPYIAQTTIRNDDFTLAFT
ncbi:MAG: hypothetical protein POG74_12715 [Acidocella sp.]|nr:hypothetical protein [Acidocella sp.]